VNGEEYAADHVVVASGAWSGALARQAGDRVLLDTERGYHVLYPGAGQLLGRPVCYPAHGFYMTPMADGLRAAGTVELGGLSAKADPRRTDMIRKGVALLLPGAGEATSEWLGFRPSMPDSLPVIGNSPASPRITYAFGHGHLGVTLAGISGRLVADLVSGRQVAINLSPLRRTASREGLLQGKVCWGVKLSLSEYRRRRRVLPTFAIADRFCLNP
jgi:glycine/D-amino acid oxidase-like deaminating enzyme